MKKLFFIYCLILSTVNFAQNYKQVDSIMATYPERFNSIEVFVDKINTDFNTDLEKTRAAFYWITHNISYDYNAAKQGLGYVIYDDIYQLERLQKNYAEKALRRRIAVCEGYAQLLKYTLKALFIKSEVISGYAKTFVDEIGVIQNNSNHSWNAVFLNNKWYLIDATWSTGNRIDAPKTFHFTEAYFLINPDALKWSHHPKIEAWQLTDKPISQNEFFNAPLIHRGYYTSGLKLSKMTGILKSNNSVEISFDTISKSANYHYILKNSSKYTKSLSFIEKDGYFIAKIHFTEGNTDELVIFNNQQACLSFKIF